MKKGLLIVAFLMAAMSLAWSQEEGYAGYSPLFNPEVKALFPDEVHETSGLFFHHGRLWTHNDSGGKPILYALDTATFEVVQRITLANVKNKDWEDVCTDGETVYVGDFGNNKGNRKNLRIYTFPLSAIPDEGDASVEVDSILFRYADQTNFEKRKLDHDYDCESVFATEHYLYVFSKGWATGTTRLYRIPKEPGEYVLDSVNGFDSQGLITGADYDRENGVLVLVGYVKDVWLPFLYLIYDFDEGVKLSNRRFELPNYLGAQTEGICFFDGSKCYVSCETSPTLTSRVLVVDFARWIQHDRNKQR